jgi:hypothetical protein
MDEPKKTRQELDRERYLANQEKRRVKANEYYHANREARLKYYHDNKQKRLAYYQENKDQILQKQKEYKLKKASKDPIEANES